MKKLFLAWQDPETRRWIPVGQLTYDGRLYRFVYTKGAIQSSRFSPFAALTDFYKAYASERLFPIFSNRILLKNRPEHKQYLNWLNVSDEGELGPIEELSRTGGISATDSLVVFPCPQPESDGHFSMKFFCNGIRHLPPPSQEWVDRLEPGRPLYLMLDTQNEQDWLAIAMRTEPVMIVGYVPRYYTEDLRPLLTNEFSKSVTAWVEKVNHEAPFQLRLLCALKAPWPSSFAPCSGALYTSLA